MCLYFYILNSDTALKYTFSDILFSITFKYKVLAC